MGPAKECAGLCRRGRPLLGAWGGAKTRALRGRSTCLPSLAMSRAMMPKLRPSQWSLGL